MEYVAYYRVSTQKQGKNGNGMKAQQQIVEDFLKSQDRLINSFKEVESGGNDARPRLKEAVQSCKDNNAQLLVAKLDRLSRSIKFLFTLKDELEEAGIGFVFADQPDLANNTMMLGVMASVAEDERKRIKQRIEEGIHQTETYQNGEWGNPDNFSNEGRQKGIEAIKNNAQDNEAWKHAFEFIRYRRELKEMSYNQIAHRLNAEGYRTRKGNKFHPATVRRIYLKFKNIND